MGIIASPTQPWGPQVENFLAFYARHAADEIKLVLYARSSANVKMEHIEKQASLVREAVKVYGVPPQITIVDAFYGKEKGYVDPMTKRPKFDKATRLVADIAEEEGEGVALVVSDFSRIFRSHSDRNAWPTPRELNWLGQRSHWAPITTLADPGLSEAERSKWRSEFYGGGRPVKASHQAILEALGSCDTNYENGQREYERSVKEVAKQFGITERWVRTLKARYGGSSYG
jgi:hypothetical protein